MDLCENARRGVVEFSTIAEAGERAARDIQLKLRAIKTPARRGQAAIAARKLAVYASLERRATWQCGCRSYGCGDEMVWSSAKDESPWRLHWPAVARDDDPHHERTSSWITVAAQHFLLGRGGTPRCT